MRLCFIGWILAAIAIVVWGVTFPSTRVLLEEFSVFEINIVPFAIAWALLWTDETKKCTIPINKSVQ